MFPAPVRTTRIAIAAAALVSLPLLLLILQYGAGRDQGIYLVVARVMHAGGMPYRDAWDFKPPGIFLIYRAALVFGGGMLPVRALEVLALTSQALAFAVLTRRFIGSAVPGAWAGALAILIHAQLEFWHTAQPESFGGPVLAWALVLATSPRNKTLGRAAAGALFGFAAFLKPPLAGGAVLVAAILAWRDARAATSKRVRAALAPFATIAAGALAVVAAFLAWLALGGASSDFVETFRDFVPRYTALGLDPHGLPGFALRAFFEWFVGYTALIPAGIALLLLCRGPEKETWGLALVGGVLIPQLAGIAFQAKFFPYHFGAALPFGALLAAWGAARAWKRFRGRNVRLAGVLLALVLLRSESTPPSPWLRRAASRIRAAFSPADRDRVLDELQSSGSMDAAANRAAASWIRGATSPGSSLFVWGFEPVLYNDTGRTPASRYIYDAPLRAEWYSRVSRPRLLDELARGRPEAILVERGDVMPEVTGDRLDSAHALERFVGLRELLDRDYAVATDTGRWVCWLRRAAR